MADNLVTIGNRQFETTSGDGSALSDADRGFAIPLEPGAAALIRLGVELVLEASSLVSPRSVDKIARRWRGSRRRFWSSETDEAARWSRQCTR